MVDITGAMKEHLRTTDGPRQEFHGFSSGLNGGEHLSRLRAIMYVTPTAVLVGWLKQRLFGFKVIVERIELGEIIEVVEGCSEKTGLLGAMDSSNARSPVLRAMGATSSQPTVTIVTRRGDLVFAFKPKDLGSVRQAYVAISDLIT